MRSSLFLLTASACIVAAATYAAQDSDTGQRYHAVAEFAHKIKVTDPAVADQLVTGGAKLVADYGTFQYFDANDSAVLDFGNHGAEARDQENRIELNAGFVDTTSATTRNARARTAASGGKRLHLIQFAGPVKPEWFSALVKTRVQVIDYIPNNAYLVYGDAAALSAVQDLARSHPAVQFEGAFLDHDRISPRLQLVAKSAAATGTYFAIQLVDDPSANAETLAVIDALKLEPVRQQYRMLQFINVVVKLQPDVIDGLAAQPDIVSIVPYGIPHKLDERQDIILSGQLSGNEPAGPGYLDWLASKGFTQAQFDSSGLAVDISDSGVDNGTQSPNHFGLYKTGNTANTSRVVYNRVEGSGNSGSTLQGCDGHGTLNSHVICGYVSLTNFPHTDSAGFRYGLGVCPFVKLGSSVIFDPNNFTSPNYASLMARAYRDGARISSDSWGDTGAAAQGAYNSDSQAYDALVRDAQPSTASNSVAGNQQMIIVFAAGNAGSAAGTVEAPGTGKNIISVAASENVHSHATTNGGNSATGNDGCTTPDSEANSANDMATFSGRGPCDDSRVKPDITAPGTHVTGGVGQNLRSMQGTGTNIPCFDGTGVCALPGGGAVGSTNNFFPLGQRFYTTSSGTSHSTPAVSGGCALLYQWFLNHFGTSPSPAMVKAWLVNAARYMNGTGANDTLPSNNQGMGMMNLGTAFDEAPRVLHDQQTNEIFTAAGQQRTITGLIVTNNRPLRITLSWTDAPGATSGNAYKNDLDLVVVAGGVTYKGNVFSGANSTSGGSADVRNNIENVFLPAGVTGVVSITVSASNINSDGVPNFGGALDQDFALVAYNVNEVFAPLIVSAGSQLVSESCGTGNAVVDPGEQVTMRFALKNLGSANTTNVMATLLATNGVTSPSGPQSYGALAIGGASISNNFTFTAAGTCGGTVFATLSLADGATDLGSVTEAIHLGGFTSSTSTRTNAAKITISSSGTASPYPSAISVTGVTGTITHVAVTLVKVSHTFPDDVDVLLVGPGGQAAVLMSDAGSGGNINNVTFTFDDNAASALPDSTTLSAGTYKPTDYEPGDAFVGPAPTGPFGSVLSAFNGTDPNGTWSLYVVDDTAVDQGAINTGWILSMDAGLPTCCVSVISADLAVSKSASPSPVLVGSNLTYTVGVTNFGPLAASGVTVTDTLPASVTFVSAISSQGTCTNVGGTVVCSLGNLTNGANASITIASTPNALGSITNTVRVSSPTNDANAANNSASVVTVVQSPPLLIVSPTNRNYGTLIVGQTSNLIFSVINSGTLTLTGTAVASGPFSVTNAAPYVVAGGQTGSVTVSFSPVAAGAFSNNVIFSSNGGGSTNAVLGSAITPASIGVSPASQDFGIVATGTSAQLSFTVTNSGQASLAGTATVTGSVFTIISGSPYTVAGSGSTNIVVNFTPPSAASFSNRLTFTSNGGGSTNPVVGQGAIPPIANFNGAPTSGLAPLSVVFTNTSTGTITNRLWDFGDGSTSNAVNPSHTFTTPGTFTVSLVVSGPLGSSTNLRSSYIFVNPPPPVADFSGSPTVGLVPLTVIFTNLTSGGGTTNFAWDFGDGETTNFENPVHAYTNVGTYTVSLVATGDGGSSTNAKLNYITVTNIPPLLGVSPANYDFGALETGTTAQFSFIVTNGGVASLTGTATVGGPFAIASGSSFSVPANSYSNVVVTFTPVAAGLASNRVIFISNGGGSTNPVVGTGLVVPSAAFSGSPTSGVAPLAVAFTNLSTGTITDHFWDFGDGATTNDSNPVHIYTNVGSFTVSLVEAGPLGASTNTKSSYVQVSSPPLLILFQGFEPGDGWGIERGSANISTNSGSADTPADQRIRTDLNSWQGNNGNVTLELANASIAGYTGRLANVRLSSTSTAGANGADAADFVRIYVALDGSLLATGAADVAVIGNSNARWGYWASNSLVVNAGTSNSVAAPQGGTSSNNYASFTIVLPDAATSVALRVVARNDNAAEFWNIDDISVTADGAAPTVAEFSGVPTQGTPPLAVSFTDLSTGPITNRAWDFGDGSTSASNNPSHTFTNAGIYTVSLAVASPFGSSTNTKTDYITITNIPPQLLVAPTNHDFGILSTGSTAQFTFAVTNGGGEMLTGTAVVGGPFAVASGNTFSVEPFGSTNFVVSFNPQAEGLFSNDVIFSSNGGEEVRPVTGSGAIAALAAFDANPTIGAVPLPVTFTNLSTGTITNQLWDLGDGTFSGAPDPVHTYTNAGSFTVSLTVFGPLGPDTITATNLIVATNINPLADLAVSKAASASALNAGDNLTYTIAVTNYGPFAASNSLVTDVLPAGMSFISASSSQGPCTNIGNVVSCNLGTLAGSTSATVSILVNATAAGNKTNLVFVTSATTDPDAGNNSAAAIVSVNAAPSISAITNQVVNEDASTDPIGFVIGDAETAAASLLVSGQSSDTNLVDDAGIVLGGIGSNRNVTITPRPDQFGNTLINISVDDGMAVTSATFSVTVNAVNDAPVLAAVTQQDVAEGTTIEVTNSASDVDLPPDALTFSLLSPPGGASVDSTNGVFSWMPTESQGPGTSIVTIVVTDDGVPVLSDTQSFVVVIGEVNLQPSLAAISNKTVDGGFTLSFTNSATDPDLPTNTLTFSLQGGPTNASVDASSGIFTWTPVEAGDYGTNTFVVRVTDSGAPSLFNEKSFEVVARPPVIVVHLAGGTFLLAWPAAAGDFGLESTTNLVPAENWYPVTDDVFTAGGLNIVSNAPSQDEYYYRLRLP